MKAPRQRNIGAAPKAGSEGESPAWAVTVHGATPTRLGMDEPSGAGACWTGSKPISAGGEELVRPPHRHRGLSRRRRDLKTLRTRTDVSGKSRTGTIPVLHRGENATATQSSTRQPHAPRLEEERFALHYQTSATPRAERWARKRCCAGTSRSGPVRPEEFTDRRDTGLTSASERVLRSACLARAWILGLNRSGSRSTCRRTSWAGLMAADVRGPRGPGSYPGQLEWS